MKTPFPFSAIVGQDEMKHALMVAAVDPSVGGILVFGDRGTGKSTAVRALAALLPPISARPDCPYNSQKGDEVPGRDPDAKEPRAVKIPTPMVDLPLGATQDRLVGTLDLERALSTGEKKFEPGLLARANRGFLYIDEVNLLEDHLVDLLLDVAASGENVVEREGLSVRHPARFVLVGSGNPEEGELRPQLLDRFGLSVEIGSPDTIEARVEVIRRRDRFDRDPAAFLTDWADDEAAAQKRIESARKSVGKVATPDAVIEAAARLCQALGSDGLRGELTLIRAARATAALDRRRKVTIDDLKRIAAPALRHRLRRDPLDETGSTARIERAVAEVLGA
jgi:magnesium chelatase subunit I